MSAEPTENFPCLFVASGDTVCPACSDTQFENMTQYYDHCRLRITPPQDIQESSIERNSVCGHGLPLRWRPRSSSVKIRRSGRRGLETLVNSNRQVRSPQRKKHTTQIVIVLSVAGLDVQSHGDRLLHDSHIINFFAFRKQATVDYNAIAEKMRKEGKTQETRKTDWPPAPP